MPVVKISLNQEYYDKVKKMAEESGATIQDVFRDAVFGREPGEPTPEEAVQRALKKYTADDPPFSLPELYGEDWTLARGYAGIFGRRFYELVEREYSDKIQYVDTQRWARYRIL